MILILLYISITLIRWLRQFLPNLNLIFWYWIDTPKQRSSDRNKWVVMDSAAWKDPFVRGHILRAIWRIGFYDRRWRQLPGRDRRQFNDLQTLRSVEIENTWTYRTPNIGFAKLLTEAAHCGSVQLRDRQLRQCDILQISIKWIKLYKLTVMYFTKQWLPKWQQVQERAIKSRQVFSPDS